MTRAADASQDFLNIFPGLLGWSQSMSVMVLSHLTFQVPSSLTCVNWPKALVLNCLPRSRDRVSGDDEQKQSLVSIQCPKAVSVQQILKMYLIV